MIRHDKNKFSPMIINNTKISLSPFFSVSFFLSRSHSLRESRLFYLFKQTMNIPSSVPLFFHLYYYKVENEKNEEGEKKLLKIQQSRKILISSSDYKLLPVTLKI